MKRYLFSKSMLVLACMVCYVCFSASATTLKQKNAFAFDIRVDAGDPMNPVVSYKLNGLASAVEIEVYSYDRLAKTVVGTTNATNEVTVPMSDVSDGTITFKVKATTMTTVTTPTKIDWADGYQDKHYKFYAPWGLAVNNCPNSKTFGQLIVCETRYYTTQTSSANYLSSTVNSGQGPMLYPYNGWFEPVKNDSKYGFNPGITVTNKQYKNYDTSYTGSEYVASFSDVAFSEDGRLFVATADPFVSDVNGPIYEANPEDLNEAATPVFPNAAANYSKTMAGAAHCVDVVGKGDDLKLAICTSKSGLKNYNAMVYTLGKNKTITSGYKQMNSPGTQSHQFRHRLAFDPDGVGITIARYNSSASSFRYHNSNTGANVKNTSMSTYNLAGISRNADGTLMARQTKNNEVTVYRCKSANGTEDLEALYTFAPGIGTWINDISFDYADNIYCCSNSSEIIRAFQLPPLEGTSKVVTVPAPASETYELVKGTTTDLYCATDWDGNGTWNPEAAHKMSMERGIYSITLPAGVNQFKLSTQLGDWDTFNSDIYIVGSNMIVGDCRDSKVYDLHQGSYNDGATDNIVLAQADDAWTVYVDLSEMKIWAEQPLKLYVRGTMSNWEANNAWQLTEGENQVYTLAGVNLNAEHEWKIAEAPMTWNKYNNYDGEQDGHTGWERHDYGGHAALKANRTKSIEFKGVNCSLDYDVANATITYDHANKTIHVAHMADVVRPAHAYDFDVRTNDDGTTATVIFKSTAAGTGRVLLVPTPISEAPASAIARYNKRSYADMFIKDNVDIAEGDNEFEFYIEDFDPNNIYNIAVEYNHAANHVFEVVDSYNGNSTSTRGGVAVIRDANSPLFGYIISSNGNAQGLWLHKPDLSEVNKYCVGAPFSNSQNSSYRMCYYDGKAYVSDQSSASGGIYTWDPVNPDEPASIIYDNATYTAPWWKDAEGNMIGARATTVKVIEDAEGNPQLWAFLADPDNWNGYKVACSQLDENGKISTAPLYTYNLGRLSNQNVELWHSKLHNGWWAGQERANGGNSSSIPVFEFMTVSGGTAKNVITSGTISDIDGGRNAIALNDDESLLFYSTRDGDIAVCDVEWEGDVPTVSFVQTIPNTRNVNGYYQFDFDPAGNLVAWGANSQIKVIAIEQKARIISMPAPDKTSFMVKGGTITSVQDIATEAASDAIYYNLNGVRVSGDKLTPGVYVKVNGSKVSKVFVK